MITDRLANYLFLADTLPKKQPIFFQRFEKILNECNINFQFLPGTKDIWARDYMPIQVSKHNYVQFIYNPDYLQTPGSKKTISDVDSICNEIGLTPFKSNLFVDGGNVVCTYDTVVMCDKVFHENKKIPKKDLEKQLKELFQVDKLYFLPWDTNDKIGHADGMVRFIDSNTVLINDYSNGGPLYAKTFKEAINKTGLEYVELPYNPPTNPSSISAKGIYINYLQMQQTVIMPAFKHKDDDKAFKILEKAFERQTIITVESNELAREGGILNCISWNIQTD